MTNYGPLCKPELLRTTTNLITIQSYKDHQDEADQPN